MPDNELKEKVKEEGKKTQVEYKGEPLPIFHYILPYNGYIWYYENNTEDKIYTASYDFTLTNLKIKGQEEDNKLSIKLHPGDSIMHKLEIIDTAEAYGYKYAWSQRVTEVMPEDEESLKAKIKEKGERKGVTYADKPIDVAYYVLFLNEQFIWVWENKTDKVYEMTLEFNLTNLELEDHVEGEPNKWIVELAPGTELMKKMKRIDPTAKTTYGFSYSHILK